MCWGTEIPKRTLWACFGVTSFGFLSVFLAAIPSLSGTRDWSCRRQVFYGQGRGGWFQDGSSTLHSSCISFLLLLHQFHLRSSGIRSQKLGTPGFVVVAIKLPSCVWLSSTPWTTACQTPGLSLSPRVCSESCSLSQWCCLTISSSATHFSLYFQSFPALAYSISKWVPSRILPRCTTSQGRVYSLLLE